MSDTSSRVARPGQSLAKVLADMPPDDHAPFLAYLEQRARITADRDMLEVVLDYRRMRQGKAFLRVV